MSNIRNYQMTPELLAFEFEYEGEKMTLQQIIDKHQGVTNFLTWAIEGKLKGYKEVRFELTRTARAKAAMNNQRSKGGRVGRTWKRQDKLTIS